MSANLRRCELDTYANREQTEAKHYILRSYLQELAFKVMHGWDCLAYIDGFSGPWEARNEDYSDTSFMIAINVLKDAQNKYSIATGKRRVVKCFFVENDSKAYAELKAAVTPYHKPHEGFEVQTFYGDFENSVPHIQAFYGSKAFPLIFIDPTGWTGYPFAKIKPLFASAKCEVLINFMYDFINRAAGMSDPKTIASLDPILGGPGWVNRLDPLLSRGLAVEKLFRETLQYEGGFKYVVSTRIDKNTADRPHFFLAYGTRDRAGLRAFREIELKALKAHAKSRAEAKDRKREERTLMPDLFSSDYVEAEEGSVDQFVAVQIREAKKSALDMLKSSSKNLYFEDIADSLMQKFVIRETNVKDILVDLEKDNFVINTWGDGRRKPKDGIVISMA